MVKEVFKFVQILERKPINTKNGPAILLRILLQEQGGYNDPLVLEVFDTALVEAVNNTPVNTSVSVSYKAKSKPYNGKYYTDVKLTEWLPLTVYKAGVHYDQVQQKPHSEFDGLDELSIDDLPH